MHEDHGHLPDLSPEDERLLDALIECGFELDALSLEGEERERAENILNLLGLMNDYPVEDSDPALVDATMARVDRFERRAIAVGDHDPNGARRAVRRLRNVVVGNCT